MKKFKILFRTGLVIVFVPLVLVVAMIFALSLEGGEDMVVGEVLKTNTQTPIIKTQKIMQLKDTTPTAPTIKPLMLKKVKKDTIKINLVDTIKADTL